MALSETQAYKIEINESKNIGVRRADIVLKDGVEIARSYKRFLYNPGDDVTAEPQDVQAVASLIWTDEVVAAYEAAVAAAYEAGPAG